MVRTTVGKAVDVTETGLSPQDLKQGKTGLNIHEYALLGDQSDSVPAHGKIAAVKGPDSRRMEKAVDVFGQGLCLALDIAKVSLRRNTLVLLARHSQATSVPVARSSTRHHVNAITSRSLNDFAGNWS